MKKLFFAILIFLTLSIKAQTIDINFLVTDGYWPLLDIRVGLDSTATNGLDPHLGEYRLPLFEGFGAVFDLSPYSDTNAVSLKDYRYAPSFPFTGTIEHRLGWQLSYYGIAFTIIYDFPPSVTANFQDEFGGMFFNENFSDSGSFTVQDNFITWAILTMHYNDVIPVELASFSASILQNERAVQIDWSTATETNNSGFEILRFTQNNNEWSTIGFVPGFGTTTEPKTYSIIDEDITTGDYKYRLKQIDFDGTFEYSNEIEVEVDFTPKEFVLYQNYPNPFNPSTTIKYSLPIESNVRIKIFNAIGEVIENLVSETQPAGTHNVVWNAQNQSSGIYYYSFEVTSSDGSQSHREMKKIVLLK